MADRNLDDDQDIDRDDDTDIDEVPYDKLMEMLGDDDDGDDGEALGTLSTPDELDRPVSVEEGLDLIDGAAKTKAKEAKVDDVQSDEDTATAQDTQPAAQDEDTAPVEAPAPDDIDALIGGLDDTARATIKARVTAADEVLGIFKGREAELERHGVKPAEAMKRLVDINAYANKNPGDYLAWAAMQLGANPQEVIGAAAERLGFKLVAATDGDEDPFEDPAVKEMREKLARYEARDRAPELGPDAPQNRVLSDLEAFQAKAPHFQTVAPQIAALAATHAQTAGKPPTMDDIKRFYDAAVMASGLQPAAPQTTPAAQPQQPVAQQTQKTTAAPSDSVQRAKAASRSLDGSGQGAGRRPAIAPDASLESVLSSMWDAQFKK